MNTYTAQMCKTFRVLYEARLCQPRYNTNFGCWITIVAGPTQCLIGTHTSETRSVASIGKNNHFILSG